MQRARSRWGWGYSYRYDDREELRQLGQLLAAGAKLTPREPASPVVPYGGGTSVVRGAEGDREKNDAVISLDLRHLNRVVDLSVPLHADRRTGRRRPYGDLLAFESTDHPVDSALNRGLDIVRGAVGRTHRTAYHREIGPTGVALLRGIKSAVDPKG